MRSSYIRLSILLLAGAVAVPVTMRIASGVERRSDPHGFRSRSSLDFTAKKSGVTELTTLFEIVPADARPDSTGHWSPRARNKFHLWLENLTGTRVRFSARAKSISPWESPDGQRRVSIEFEHLRIVICGSPVMFDIGGAFPVSVTVSSARELDEWFEAPQNSIIRVEATLESVDINNVWSPLVLREVKAAWK